MPGAGAVSLVLSVGDRSRPIDRPSWTLDVREVPDRTTATAVLDDEPVDCVVADLDLPDGDGLDLCADVRGRDDEVPAILVVDDPDRLGDRAVEAIEADLTAVVEPGTDLGETVADAIQRAETRRERARDQELFRALLRRIPMSIYVKDEHCTNVAAAWSMVPEGSDDYMRNAEGKVIQHADDLLGKTDFDVFPTEYAKQTVADDREVMETGEPIVDKIEEIRNPFGETLYYSTSKAPRYDDAGDVVGLVGASLDVTERVVNRRELERQNEQLDQFASIITHDLRNPLSVATGYLQALDDRYDDPEIDEVTESLDRMETLIEELLAFAREGQTVVEFESVDLGAVARDAWRNVETGDADLEVRSELPVEGDRDRMQRLFENVFRNAIEHGLPDGADPAGLTVRVVDDGPDFHVADDGAGFRDVALEEVFDRGVTTDPTGTGYGLAIVENISNAHGWEVRAAESRDGGARFEFTGVVRTERVPGADD